MIIPYNQQAFQNSLTAYWTRMLKYILFSTSQKWCHTFLSLCAVSTRPAKSFLSAQYYVHRKVGLYCCSVSLLVECYKLWLFYFLSVSLSLFSRSLTFSWAEMVAGIFTKLSCLRSLLFFLPILLMKLIVFVLMQVHFWTLSFARHLLSALEESFQIQFNFRALDFG